MVARSLRTLVWGVAIVATLLALAGVVMNAAGQLQDVASQIPAASH